MLKLGQHELQIAAILLTLQETHSSSYINENLTTNDAIR